MSARSREAADDGAHASSAGPSHGIRRAAYARRRSYVFPPSENCRRPGREKVSSHCPRPTAREVLLAGKRKPPATIYPSLPPAGKAGHGRHNGADVRRLPGPSCRPRKPSSDNSSIRRQPAPPVPSTVSGLPCSRHHPCFLMCILALSKHLSTSIRTIFNRKMTGLPGIRR